MSIQTDLVDGYSRNSWLVQRHLDGLDQADTLIRPNGTGNCINYIFGHILLCRVEMLELLGQPAAVTPQALGRYDTGADPVGPDSTDICPLEQLEHWWTEVDAEFLAALRGASDETMQRRVKTSHGEVELYRRLHFFYFHETFHIGQFEILRHLAGKTESLI